MGEIRIGKKPKTTNQVAAIAAKTVDEIGNDEALKCETGIEEIVNARYDDPAVICEDEAHTDEYSRHYEMNDGTIKSVVKTAAVNYYDETEKKWKEIDNSLVENEKEYSARLGKFTAGVSKPEYGEGVTLKNTDAEFSWEYIGRNKLTADELRLNNPQKARATLKIDESVEENLISVKSTDDATVNNSATENDAATVNNNSAAKQIKADKQTVSAAQGAKAKRVVKTKNAGGATYKNVEQGVDIQYKLENNNLKENIIVRERSDSYWFYCKLNSKGFEIALSEDGTQIEAKRDGKKEFVIPAPFMTDASGRRSDEVYYEIESVTGDEYIFAVIASSEWINSKSTEFPVTIDPQIITDSGNTSFTFYGMRYISDECHEGWYDENCEYDNALGNIGREDYKTIIRFTPPIVNSAYKTMAKAQVCLQFENYYLGEYSVSVNNKGRSVESPYNELVKVDITSEMKNHLSCELVISPVTMWTGYYTRIRKTPYFEITYATNEDTVPTIETYGLAGALNGNLNVQSGELTADFADAYSDGVLSYGVSHLFKKSAKDFGAGKNFRLNLHEKFEKCNDSALDANYLYTDQSGTVQAFKDSYYYENQSGKKIYIDKSSVAVDLNGALSYTLNGTTYEVKKEQRTPSGLKAITELSDFKRVEVIEKRSEEQANLEEQLEGYENALTNYVLVDKSDYSVKFSLNKDTLNYESVKDFFTNYSSGNYVLVSSLQKDNYISIKSQLAAVEEKASNSAIECAKNKYLNLAALFIEIYSYKLSLDGFVRIGNFGSSSVSDKINTINNILNNTEKLKIVNSSDYSIFADSVEYNNGKDTSDYNCMYGAEIKKLFEQRNIKVGIYNAQLKVLKNQIATYKSQLELITSSASSTADLVKKHFKNYVNVKNKLETLKSETPVNYLTDGSVTKGFNASGDLTIIFDNYKNYAVVDYEDYDYSPDSVKYRILGLTFSDGKTIAVKYNKQNRISTVTGVDGKKTNYTYDSSGRLTKISRGSEEVTIGYNESYEIISVLSEKNALKTALSYNDSGKLTGIVQYSTANKITADGALKSGEMTIDSYSITYASACTEISKNSNQQVRYCFDSLKNCSEIRTVRNNKVVDCVQYNYKAYDYKETKRARKTLLNKSVNDFEFKNGETESVYLNEFNLPKSKWVEKYIRKGYSKYKRIEYTYDDDNRLITEKEIEDGKTICKNYLYNANGSLVRTESYAAGEENKTGKTIEETVYDNNGNVVRAISYNSLSPATKFYSESAVDETGKTLYTVDGTGLNKTEYEYSNGNSTVTAEKYPNGSKFSSSVCEDEGYAEITQSTLSGEKNSTEKRYVAGLITMLKSGNDLVKYTYDHKRRLTGVSLNGNDDYLKIERSESDLNFTVNDVRDDSVPCDVTTVTDALGKTIKTYVDKSGRTRKIIKNGSVIFEAVYDKHIIEDTCCDVVGYYDYVYVDGNIYYIEYDGEKRLVKVTKNNATIETREYDSQGKITKKVENGREYNYEYDGLSTKNVKKITRGGLQTCYDYDNINRVKAKFVCGESGTKAGEYYSYASYGDHAVNRISTINYGGNLNGKYCVNESLRYDYDALGNISSVYENGFMTVKYTYDGLNRLTREDNKTLGKTYLYGYDNNGNVISKRECAYTVKSVDEITETTNVALYCYATDSDRLISYNGEAFAYDVVGNPVTYRGKPLTFSGRNMTAYDGLAFTYSGSGQRTKKGDITYAYSYDGKLISETAADGTVKQFVYTHNGLSGIIYGGQEYLYRRNAQGDITAILNLNGEVVARYAYDGWGNHAVLNPDGTDNDLADFIGNVNPFRYRGYYYDKETGLYFLKTRYYDPEICRFINVDDTAYLDAESINGLNLYAYCADNPIMNVDPDGTAWWHWLLGGLLVVGLTVLTAGVAGVVAAGVGAAIGVGSALVSATVTGAVIGGLVAGGIELVAQGITTNWQSVDYGSLGIQTVSGAASGALSGMAGATTLAPLKISLRGGFVAVSGLTSVANGIHKGDSFATIVKNAGMSMLFASLMQGVITAFALGKGYGDQTTLYSYIIDGYLPNIKLTNLMILGGGLLKGVWRNTKDYLAPRIINFMWRTFKGDNINDILFA